MSPSIFYCKSWFRLKHRAIDPMDEATANALHLAKKPYTALIGSDSKPACFVEMILDKNMVGVGFLDDHQREYLTYQFQCLDSETLFLTMAIHREFDDAGKISVGTSYIFKESGELLIRREQLNPHKLEEAKSHFEPKDNYEKIPEFGDYSNVTKVNR
ncbi:lytic transglycosylase [Pseudomonas savastanoi]|uniref:lytic transglycosylase n=1 Tax=Pseudomonas savastanoi TaxID=29438 RepID=UPI000EFFFB6C|nr:lytic transglycosylase [Pseudomonas savastanoi]